MQWRFMFAHSKWKKFSSNLKETNLLNRLVMVFWVHKLGDTKFLGCGQEQRKWTLKIINENPAKLKHSILKHQIVIVPNITFTFIEPLRIQINTDNPWSTSNSSPFSSLIMWKNTLLISRSNKEFKKSYTKRASCFTREERLTARPTAPIPKIATVEPFFGFATFKVAPRPKEINLN